MSKFDGEQIINLAYHATTDISGRSGRKNPDENSWQFTIPRELSDGFPDRKMTWEIYSSEEGIFFRLLPPVNNPPVKPAPRRSWS